MKFVDIIILYEEKTGKNIYIIINSFNKNLSILSILTIIFVPGLFGLIPLILFSLLIRELFFWIRSFKLV